MMKQICDHRRISRIRDKDALSERADCIQVTHARAARINTGARLLQHALFRLLTQIEAIVASHQDLDAVYKLLRRARIRANDDVFLDKMNGNSQLVERRPVLEVPVESVGLFHQNCSAGMFLEIRQHLCKAGSTTLLGRLHVDELLRNREAFFQRVLAQQALLRRDRETLLLLIFAGDSGVEHCLALRLRGATLCRLRTAGLRRRGSGYSSRWRTPSTLTIFLRLSSWGSGSQAEYRDDRQDLAKDDLLLCRARCPRIAPIVASISRPP